MIAKGSEVRKNPEVLRNDSGRPVMLAGIDGAERVPGGWWQGNIIWKD